MKRTLYLLCTTSRTGSTHLCQLLAATGRLGTPDEYFNQPQMSAGMRQAQLTKEYEYVEHILKTTSTPNGVCGIKLATDACARLRAALGPLFELLSPKYLWLRRRDTLRQAISLYRATASGVWHWPAGEPRPAAAVPLDAAAIGACRQQIAAANAEWSRWFGAAAIVPLELWYEELAASPRAAIETIGRFVGAQDLGCPQNPAARLQVLRDEITERWVGQLGAST